MREFSATPKSSDSGVLIDPDEISADALRGLVEEFVSREGTEYGRFDWSLEEKVAQVYQQLERGEARIVFNVELESASIVAESVLSGRVGSPD